MGSTTSLTRDQAEAFLQLLQKRFISHPERHKDIRWEEVEAKLRNQPDKLGTLFQMEESGGQPDVVGNDKTNGIFIFYDCAPQSPAGRRSLCYDKAARLGRKKYPPENSALEMALAMGVQLMSESQYRELQSLGSYDTKTSSWIRTPDAIRNLGGALFCDRRYNNIFTYHNGADSYYAARGFRGVLEV